MPIFGLLVRSPCPHLDITAYIEVSRSLARRLVGVVDRCNFRSSGGGVRSSGGETGRISFTPTIAGMSIAWYT